jgi:hypothetical protein
VVAREHDSKRDPWAGPEEIAIVPPIEHDQVL